MIFGCWTRTQESNLSIEAWVDEPATFIGAHMIHPGSIVRLQSGGPNMTALRYNSKGEVHCAWFSGATWYEHPFPEPALKIMKGSEES